MTPAKNIDWTADQQKGDTELTEKELGNVTGGAIYMKNAGIDGQVGEVKTEGGFFSRLFSH
jgi:hypothetical protein